MALHLTPLREADLNLATQFIVEAEAWSPRFQLGVHPMEVLQAPNSLWLSALNEGELIGILGFSDISWPDGTANVALGIVPKWRTKGLGRILAVLQNEYAFNEMRLRRIQMIALAGSPSCKIASRAGLTLEGTLRKCRFKGGTYHDASIYALVKE
jgi:RimJ/RimL family protein N-acetyltransferase